MSKTLTEIAQQLNDTNKKVQLIYAFNGAGKTRLSKAFKELVAPKNHGDEVGDDGVLARHKILYYNAFTEDLFYWDNDLERDAEPKLKIQPNSFTDWILKDQGQDRNIITNFQRYSSQSLTPHFNENFSEITFTLERGDDARTGNLKISKGEESNFIWSVFQTLIDQVTSILSEVDIDQRETDQFDQLKYVFIDDPVTSLDENHLIELAVTLAELIKANQSGIKFIITTHNPLFFNVLHNEFKNKACYLLERLEDGSFKLSSKEGASNKSFSYHHYLKETLEQAIAENNIQKYHFTLLRNLYEKTANFLGYSHWSDLLDTAKGDKQGYLKRIVNFSSHRTLSGEEVAPPTAQEKQMVKLLLDNLLNNYGFLQQEEQNG
jgi:hypothetical protein